MSMSDVIGDMLTRIRNGQKSLKSSVLVPHSTLKTRVLDVLRDEGYIRGYSLGKDSRGHDQISVELKYYEGLPVIQRVQRCSKPGLRVYSPIKELSLVSNGLGISILSTSKGVMSDVEARRQGVGGEVICSVF